MNHKLNCPVCGYQEIAGDICPNCDTDISLIRSLYDLPQIKKSSLQQKFSSWTLGVALLMLIIGIGLGVGGSFLLMQPNLYNATIFFPQPTIIKKYNPSKNTPPSESKILNIYIVKPGDNLSLIAEKFCGNGDAWEEIVKANPHLQNREKYYIDPGEKLKIPNCQERTP
ncbi:LysM peptidoglycan-binding domain-containing protein [Sphaerospermopsis aphanizomenoides BCCUSP55]|uniref:LysM peptidoglycan-binding domain-containing protein n=1 Tax=Sphaerospermopsis aphanizomenoides TaxID=459663 RepID=UPI001905896C|nr:LysM peptidoglycan-binding domain-containing protein [Sphaerospermopsis aphanizomenoides]MBK1987026.1 LysM peptidoglycan-binding domain-containing protein [Sphaerospermopsis aphanizomenoides BCCUSP55]